MADLRAASRSRFWYLPLLAVFLLGAEDKKGCSCKADEEDIVEDTGEEEVVDVQVELQVTSIDPASGEAGQRFDATVYGSGFAPGARVHFTDQAGLSPEVRDENTLGVGVPSLDEGTYDVVVTNPDGTRASLRRGLSIEQSLPDCSFLRVHFEFDASRLVDDATAALDDLMPCYRETQATILLEGHADERGTIDYNIALGQRRADAVQRYLTGRGVSPTRIDTVSYGEERPLDEGHDEEAWARNRRVEITVGR